MNEEGPSGLSPADQQAFRVAYLVAGFIRNTLTGAEQVELDDWVTANMENQRLFERLIDEKNIDGWMRQKDGFNTEAALEKIKTRISFEPLKKQPSVYRLWPYAATACIVIALVTGFLFTGKNKPGKKPAMDQTVTADIAPGKNSATLRLSGGQTILLDTLSNGLLTTQGNANIRKLDSGQLVYQRVNPSMMPQAESYNLLTVPAAGQYKLVLPDGTRVWLNASSSLRYPTVFGGAKRSVELSGEGYFEVAKDPMFPFVVTVNGVPVQVMGTHFNVNGYGDEPDLKVVLEEGAVKFNNTMVLKPGEMGVLGRNGNMVKARADMEQALAWKNGQFVFKETPIDVLMRQVGRWYNSRVVYKDTIHEHFNASIPRGVPVSRLLHLLEATGRVRFGIENNTIIVMK